YSASPSVLGPDTESSSQAQLRDRPAHREKRCSCENLKDKECVYFCHIGIVWVNTPGQVVPYGVGFPVRLKRAIWRCACANSSDSQCLQFCSVPASHLLKEQVRSAPFKRIFPSKSREKYKSWTFERQRRK
ncbi:hypothetical protein JZ751_005105, partial [Albula glossodonta]